MEHYPLKMAFLLVFLAFLFSCSTKPNIIHPHSPYTLEGDHTVYVVSHGWHTGFVIPAKKIKTQIPALAKRFPDTEYIEFGWGDKGFYQAKEITSGLTLRAIFWPTESVIHAVATPEDVASFFKDSEIKKLCLNDAELSSLIQFISESFAKNQQGEVIPLKQGIYGDSQFYQGSGDYYLMNTCNKWTAKGLKSIGMDIAPTFKLTAGSIIHYLENNVPAPSKPSCIKTHESGAIPSLQK